MSDVGEVIAIAVSKRPRGEEGEVEEGPGDKKPRMDRARKPRQQAFDEVRIVTVPRYKTSQFSGDEWRISATAQLLYKGVVVKEEVFYGNVESAIMGLPSLYKDASEDLSIQWPTFEEYCDQEGCKEKATTTLKLKKNFCHCGAESDPYEFNKDRNVVRRFCDRHSTRGDCGLEDADRNYEILDGGSQTEPPAEDKSQSAVVFI